MPAVDVVLRSAATQVRTRTDVDVCLELFAVPPTREQAVRKLAATFPPTRQPHVIARWRSTMLDGSPVGGASATDLEIENVALAGWALDRQHRGLHNEGGWSWVQAARVAHAILSAMPQAA